MSASTPLVFRPSLAQRSLVGVLFAGSWIVGIRLIILLVQGLPRMHGTIRLAQASSEPTFWLWVSLVAAIVACVVGAFLLVLSLMALLLVEGTHVFVDELGLTVEYLAVPRRLARWFGAGRLTWKEISSLEKHRFFFVLRGEAGSPALRFLLVDELERLILLIIESSPNLRF